MEAIVQLFYDLEALAPHRAGGAEDGELTCRACQNPPRVNNFQ